MRLPALTFAAAAVVALAGPVSAENLGDLMRRDEAARPGPTSSQATDPAADQGSGSAITRSLRPGDATARPFVGPGSDERVPVDQALDMLREAHAAVRALRQEAIESPPRANPNNPMPEAEAGQQILGDAQRAVLAVQHSGALSTDSPLVRDTLEAINEAQRAVVQGPGGANVALDRAANQMATLLGTAQQAATRQP